MIFKQKFVFIKISVFIIFFIIFFIFIISLFFGKYDLEETESTKIYDKYGDIIYDNKDQNFDKNRKTNYTSLEEVPEELLKFIIWKEDKRFYNHIGIDIKSIIRAIYQKIKGKSIQGASTIDQQVIKLSQEAFNNRSFVQKIKEIILAVNINIYYDKKEVLLYYINNLFFPKGVKGFATACEVYFNKSCSELNTNYYIYLYAKARFPSQKSIVNYASVIQNKYNKNNYNKNNYIDKEEFINIESSEGFRIKSNASRFARYIMSQNKNINNKKILTHFDTKLYNKIQNIVYQYENHLYANDTNNLCVVVLESGKTISMNSLKNYGDTYINGCLTPRQVGSAIKPFIYLLALEKLGYNIQTVIKDEEISFESQYGIYSPKNFDMKNHGYITLGEALGNSLNIPTIKITNEIGLYQTYNFLAYISNITESNTKRNDDINHIGLVLALGVKEISPLDFTKMWQIFNPNFCLEKSEIIQNFCKKNIDNIQQIRDILSNNNYRLISFGQNNRFDIFGTYAKSGTSRHFIDGWICGGKNKKTICIWAGNFENHKMRSSGHDIIGPIRHNIINIL